MSLVPVRRVGRRFRGLETDRRLSFIAALWTARGFETTVEDGVVVASRDGKTVRIGPVDGSRLRRLFAGAIPPIGAPPAEAGVDVLVDEAADRGRRSFSEFGNEDVRRVGPADLRELLAYGVDREIGERLAREYLDTPLVVEDPRRSPIATRVNSPFGAVAALLAIAVLATVLLGGVLGGVPAGVPLSAGDGPGDGAGTPDRSTEESSVFDDETGNWSVDDAQGLEGESELPPGLSLSGVEDASRLAHAHRRSLPTSRTVEIDFEGPPDAIGFQGIVATSLAWEAETSIRYHAESAVTFANRNRSSGEELRSREVHVFADGDREYVGFRDDLSGDDRNGSFDEYRVFRLGSFFSPTDSPSATRIDRYLDSNETRLEVVTERTHPRYVVVATEPPAGLPDTVESYRARAIVRPDGIVTRLEVTYERRDADRTTRYEQRVSKLERTTVVEPAWVEEAREGQREQ